MQGKSGKKLCLKCVASVLQLGYNFMTRFSRTCGPEVYCTYEKSLEILAIFMSSALRCPISHIIFHQEYGCMLLINVAHNSCRKMVYDTMAVS